MKFFRVLFLTTAASMALTPVPRQTNGDGRFALTSKQDEIYSSNINGLVARSLSILEHSDSTSPVFIGIAGAPGSGKSTIAQHVVDAINKAKDDVMFSIVLPMDGYHFSQAQLRDMGEMGVLIGDPDATAGETTTFDDLMKRRGAPWTFDSDRLIHDLRAAKEAHEGSFPRYDRQISDPAPDQIVVTQEHKIVVCEGNYLLSFDDPKWKPLQTIWDDAWLIDTSERMLIERLVRRHLQTWTAAKEERFGVGRAGVAAKIESSDMKNVKWVYQTSWSYANLIVRND